MNSHQRSLFIFLAYFAPFLLVYVYKLWILNEAYFSSMNDSAPSALGLGLGWLNAKPLLVFHIPGYFLFQMAGLAAYLTGMPTNDLRAFANFGVLFNFIFAVLGAAWMSKVARTMKLSLTTTFAIAIMAASMPTMMLQSTFWVPSYFLIHLAIPALLLLYHLYSQNSCQTKNLFLPFFALGFCVANSYLFLALLLPILALLCGPCLKDLRRGELSPLNPIFLSLFAGWLIGTNIAAPFWFVSIFFSLKTKGGAALPTTDPYQLYTLEFLKNATWHWFILVAAILSIFALWKRWGKNDHQKGSCFAGGVGLGMILLNGLVALNIIFEAHSKDLPTFGQNSRYWLLTVPVLAMLLVWTFERTSRIAARVLISVYLVLGGLSAFQYHEEMAFQVRLRNRANQEISSLAKDFLEREPRGIVVCSRTVLPEFCAVLYGYHNYLLPAVQERFPNHLPGEKRILYASEDEKELRELLKDNAERKNPVFFIREKFSHFVPSEMRPVWQDPALEVSVWRTKT